MPNNWGCRTRSQSGSSSSPEKKGKAWLSQSFLASFVFLGFVPEGGHKGMLPAAGQPISCTTSLMKRKARSFLSNLLKPKYVLCLNRRCMVWSSLQHVEYIGYECHRDNNSIPPNHESSSLLSPSLGSSSSQQCKSLSFAQRKRHRSQAKEKCLDTKMLKAGVTSPF